MKKLIIISFCLIFIIIGGCKFGKESSVVGADGKIDPEFIIKIETAMKKMAKDQGWDYIGKEKETDEYVLYAIDSDKTEMFKKGGKSLDFIIYKTQKVFKSKKDKLCQKKTEEWSTQYSKGKICCSDNRVKAVIIIEGSLAGAPYNQARHYEDQYELRARIDYEKDCSAKEIVDLFLDKYFDNK